MIEEPNVEIESEEDHETSIKKTIKRRKPGIIYLSSIPPTMTVLRIREYFSKFGKLGNVYLEEDKKSSSSKFVKRKKLTFKEGWIEFQSKRKAKFVSTNFNNTPVGGKKKYPDRDTLWNIKYLPRFKWVYLRQRLEFERQIHRQRLGAEIHQVKQDTDHYINVSNKKDRVDATYVFQQKLTEDEILKKKEAKKLKSERFQRKFIERKKSKKEQKQSIQKTDDFVSSVFVGAK